MSLEREELTGTVKKVIWTRDDGTFTIAVLFPPTYGQKGLLDTKPVEQSILGTPPSSGLLAGMTYTFRGKWEESEKHGRQFRFDSATEKPNATRSGVVEYLRRYAPHVGDATAHAIVDQFGVEHAIDKLKADPAEVAARIRGFTEDKATAAAQALIKAQKFQETRVQLLDLLANRGFGEPAIDACIKVWGVHAPAVVRRDPFKLMLKRIPGAGFMRCDKIWHELGLPSDRLKRQVMAAWHHLRTDQSGSTWHAKDDVIRTVRSLITGNARPERAIAIAIVAKRLVQCERNGRLWVAETKKAEDEASIASKVCLLMATA